MNSKKFLCSYQFSQMNFERKISEVFIFAKPIKIYGTLGDYKPKDLIDKDTKV